MYTNVIQFEDRWILDFSGRLSLGLFNILRTTLQEAAKESEAYTPEPEAVR